MFTTRITTLFTRILTVSAVALLASALVSGLSAQETRQYIQGRSAATPGGPPFSGAVMAGNTLYLSGMLGVGGGRAGGAPLSVEDEARNVLNSIRSTLEAAGMTMDDLVQVQIFCSDLSTYAAFNEIYRTYFTQEFPARAFLGSGTLLNGARFEVMGIAVKRG